MYCPSCGAESAQGLRYCKQCGANLYATDAVELPRKFPGGMVVGFLLMIGLITICGLTIPMAASSDLRNSGFSPNGIMQLFALSVTATLVLDALLIWLLLKLINIYQQSHAPAQARESRPPAIKEFTPPQLNAPPPAIASVTEHTTRNFDEYEKTLRARQAGRDTNEV